MRLWLTSILLLSLRRQIPWLYPPEIMPLAFRAKGTSLSTATNWIFNYIVGEMTPILQEKIKWRLYPMHAFFCLCSLIFVYFAYPETMGVPLEEMEQLFGDEPGPIPQKDDELDEENQPLNQVHTSHDEENSSTVARPSRRSISSHPRFMNEEELAAREAAIKVARLERRNQTWNFMRRGSSAHPGRNGRSRASILNWFGGNSQSHDSAHQNTEYQPLYREER